MKTLKDFDFKNKKVLVRCDFNIPLAEEGNILDDYKIKQALPTINYILDSGAGVVLMSHLGRPEGKVVESLRLAPVAKRLSELLSRQVAVAEKNINSGEIIFLENIQFNPGEIKNDLVFAKKLSEYGDIFVMEAFAQAHRAYASICGINKFIPSCSGFLFEKEISALDKIIKNPKRPLVAVLGGAKIETKTKLIDNISDVADFVLVGGLLQKELKEKKINLKNPQKIIGAGEGLDIPQEDVIKFKEKIKNAKTILWNGPLGKIEDKNFTKGTEEIVKAIIDSGAYSVAGGGETVEFIDKLGLVDKFNHVSTGGGAMLTFLAGEKLPGLEALK